MCSYSNSLDHNPIKEEEISLYVEKKKSVESRGEMLRVSAETSASDVMVQGLYVRNWEEHPSLPKKEMEVKGEE